MQTFNSVLIHVAYRAKMNGNKWLPVMVEQVAFKKKIYGFLSKMLSTFLTRPSIHPSLLVVCALIPAFFCPSLHRSYPSIPSIKTSDVCICGRVNCLVVICNVNMWLRVRAPLPLDAP